MAKAVVTYERHIHIDGGLAVEFKAQGDDKAALAQIVHKMRLREQSTKEPVKYDIDIKVYRAKRSINANDYAWQLLGQLSKALKTPSSELYREYVRDLGIKRTAKIDSKSAQTLITAWQDRGLAWIAEKIDDDGEFAMVDLYYGSSCYDTKQMSRLVDLIVQDCKSQNIPTMTPAELARLEGLKERVNDSRN